MNKIPECLIHPVSTKLLLQGHPWITPDNFSNRFPRQSEFVIATDERKRPIALLIHDPLHKNIKARVWSTKPPFDREAQHFTASIQGRLDLAFEKRIKQKELKEIFHQIHGDTAFSQGISLCKDLNLRNLNRDFVAGIAVKV